MSNKKHFNNGFQPIHKKKPNKKNIGNGECSSIFIFRHTSSKSSYSSYYNILLKSV